LAAKNRTNPLALALLICLYERPMHPYEAATTLRQRGKHYSVRLNYGSLYAVVESLERRGLIEAVGTQREGRLPERTVYRLTNAGQVEAEDWLTDLVSTPVKEYPAFEAALSFLPALPPDQASELLEERAGHLEFQIAQAEAIGEMMQKHALPRLFRIEDEYSLALRRTELEFVRKLANEIRTGSLEGSEWWRSVHHGPDDVIAYPRDWDSSIGNKEE
jgi:DNA-binding PadR family transcriptional regulator